MSTFERYLTLWVAFCIAAGMGSAHQVLHGEGPPGRGLRLEGDALADLLVIRLVQTLDIDQILGPGTPLAHLYQEVGTARERARPSSETTTSPSSFVLGVAVWLKAIDMSL